MLSGHVYFFVFINDMFEFGCYEFHYCEPYKYNDIGYLPRQKTFYELKKAEKFKIKMNNETQLHCEIIKLELDVFGIFEVE